MEEINYIKLNKLNMDILLTNRFKSSIFFQKFRIGYYPTTIHNIFFNHRHIPEYSLLHDKVKEINFQDYSVKGLRIDLINNYEDINSLINDKSLHQIIILSEELYEYLYYLNNNLNILLDELWLHRNVTVDNLDFLQSILKLLEMKNSGKTIFVSGEMKNVKPSHNHLILPVRLLKSILILSDEETKTKINKLISIVIRRSDYKIFDYGYNVYGFSTSELKKLYGDVTDEYIENLIENKKFIYFKERPKRLLELILGYKCKFILHE